MTAVTERSFGLLIAYVIPGFGFIALWGSEIPQVSRWMTDSTATSPTVGGFLYITIASVTSGLVLHTLRWAILDRLHHATGLRPPAWNRFADPVSLDAYRSMVDFHYRYYEFYGSSLLLMIALVLLPPSNIANTPDWRLLQGALIALSLIFFAASRDTLNRCYSRFPGLETTTPLQQERNTAMTNGGPHPPESTLTKVVVPEPQKQPKPKKPETASDQEGETKAEQSKADTKSN